MDDFYEAFKEMVPDWERHKWLNPDGTPSNFFVHEGQTYERSQLRPQGTQCPNCWADGTTMILRATIKGVVLYRADCWACDAVGPPQISYDLACQVWDQLCLERSCQLRP